MEKTVYKIVILILLLQVKTFAQADTQWFEDARFGLFIHWGLYAIPGGVWDGEPVHDNRYINPYAEHIMHLNKIPLKTYAGLAKEFNPVKWDAKNIVKMAKAAGMKYLVLTSKHHDGFAMFDSKVSDFTIVKSTPYHTDVAKELAEACADEEIKMCFYYSLGRDWEQPNAVGRPTMYNDWDYNNHDLSTYQHYLDQKVKPQLKELLTQYGPVGMIWFDSPELTTVTQSQEIYDWVKKWQPDCLVNTRVGNKIGDIKEMGDNQIPREDVGLPWQTPGTMAESWGYSLLDTKAYWKSGNELIFKLVEIAAKGGNYLLNIGPDGNGALPTEAKERLEILANWMQTNAEAIHSTTPYKLPKNEYRGYFTQNNKAIYVHLTETPENGYFTMYIDPKTIKRAVLLTPKGEQDLSLSPSFGKGIVLKLPSSLPFTSINVLKLYKVD